MPSQDNYLLAPALYLAKCGMIPLIILVMHNFLCLFISCLIVNVNIAHTYFTCRSQVWGVSDLSGNGLNFYMQLLTRLGLDEYWCAACRGKPASCFWEWEGDNVFLFWGRRCVGKPKKWSLKVAHSPKVIPRSSLRSATSPKISAEPLRSLRVTISAYLLSNPILSN